MATVIIKGYPNTKTTIKLPKVVRVVVKVEGPFDTVNNKLEYIEKEKEYIYVATLRNNNVNPKKINWAISYDKDDHCKSYKLFSGGELDGDTLKVKIKTEKPKEKFKIYAYAGNLPHKDVFVEVNILNLPICIDMFRMPGLNNEGTDIAEDLTYGKGENIVRRVYPDNFINKLKKDYISNTFFTSTLSNKDDKYDKTLYSKEEIYKIDYKNVPWYLKVENLL